MTRRTRERTAGRTSQNGPEIEDVCASCECSQKSKEDLDNQVGKMTYPADINPPVCLVTPFFPSVQFSCSVKSNSLRPHEIGRAHV